MVTAADPLAANRSAQPVTDVDQQFVQSTLAGIVYWQQRLQAADETGLSTLNRERRNILYAIEFGLRLPQTLRDAAALTLHTFYLVHSAGHLPRWIPIFEWAASLVGPIDGALQRQLWNRVGQLYHAASRLDEAVAAHRWVAQAAREAGDEQAEAQALFHLAEDFRQQHEYDQAHRYAQQALQRFEALGSEDKWTAGALNTLAMVAWRRGQRQEAEAQFRRVIELYRTLGKKVQLARALNNLGGVLREQESYEAARETYEEAAAVLANTGATLEEVIINISLASLYYEQEQYEAAENAFRAADTPYLQRSGHSHYQAYVANGLGNTFWRQGRLRAAEAKLKRAVALWREADGELMMANSIRSIARVLAAQGRPREAVAHYDEALQIAVRYKDDAWARELASEIREERERTAGAADSE
ncbi:MAG TPA: tetratricopeptide repeat protein [Candidatus Sulfomarinibacteraceae bacterium]|nr:tetratricopeptide repeat protein [Candidatus Sulfomarinibacteraceae bacterium]